MEQYLGHGPSHKITRSRNDILKEYIGKTQKREKEQRETQLRVKLLGRQTENRITLFGHVSRKNDE